MFFCHSLDIQKNIMQQGQEISFLRSLRETRRIGSGPKLTRLSSQFAWPGIELNLGHNPSLAIPASMQQRKKGGVFLPFVFAVKRDRRMFGNVCMFLLCGNKDEDSVQCIYCQAQNLAELCFCEEFLQ